MLCTGGAPTDTGGGATGGWAKGGPVGVAPLGFARGGTVFTRPLWNKVPGVGNADTVPALLQSGSFVLRKLATQNLGDTLLGKLARGFADGGMAFATGGSVSPALDLFKKLHELKTQAQTEFSKILDRASGLPHATWGQDVRDYVKRVLELISASNDPTEIQAFLDRVLVYYNSFNPALEDAQQFHVPLVMGAFTADPAAQKPNSTSKSANTKLATAEGLFGGGRGSAFGFAVVANPDHVRRGLEFIRAYEENLALAPSPVPQRGLAWLCRVAGLRISSTI